MSKIKMVFVDFEKPGLYTVKVFDKTDICVARVDDVLAWTRREAYFSVMHKIAKHRTWDAWRTENLEKRPMTTAPASATAPASSATTATSSDKSSGCSETR